MGQYFQHEEQRNEEWSKDNNQPNDDDWDMEKEWMEQETKSDKLSNQGKRKNKTRLS